MRLLCHRNLFVLVITVVILVAVGVTARKAANRRELAMREIERVGGQVRLAPSSIVHAWLHMHDVAKISFHRVTITDDILLHVKELNGIRRLDIASTEVTDEGIIHLKGLTELRFLDLGFTNVTDAALVHLKDLTELRELGLCNTAITDEGLVHLAGLTKLQHLMLQRTQVTYEGVSKLEQALPNCDMFR